MTSYAERLQRILDQPLDYLHPQRLSLPPDFGDADARRDLNLILSLDLDLQRPEAAPALTAMAELWVRHWQQLPYIATLMGAWRLFALLSLGGALQQLPLPLRRFASCNPGRRAVLPVGSSPVSMQQVQAAGFKSLLSWSDHIPQCLLARLPLQFSASVVDMHEQWPATEPDKALFFMAVQHARYHPNPD